MAFTLDFTDPLNGQPRYNIDFAIGKFDRKSDVMLLQVLLNLLYFDLASGSAALGFVAPAKERLKEDGKLGDLTSRFIVATYLQLLKNSANLAPFVSRGADTLDPMRAPGERSKLMNVNYFIDVLQDNISFLDAQQQFGRYGLLRFDNDVPAHLRNALKTVKDTAAQYDE